MNDPIGARAFAEGDWERFRHLAADANLSELEADAALGEDPERHGSGSGFAVGPVVPSGDRSGCGTALGSATTLVRDFSGTTSATRTIRASTRARERVRDLRRQHQVVGPSRRVKGQDLERQSVVLTTTHDRTLPPRPRRLRKTASTSIARFSYSSLPTFWTASRGLGLSGTVSTSGVGSRKERGKGEGKVRLCGSHRPPSHHDAHHRSGCRHAAGSDDAPPLFPRPHERLQHWRYPQQPSGMVKDRPDV